MELLPLVCLCLLSCSGDAVRVVVEEDSDAVLPCLISTEEDITGKLFDWRKDGQKEVFMYNAGIHYNNGLQGQDEQFKGRVSFFQDQLQNGDASIKITRTKMADSGNYSCIFPHYPWIQTSIIELVVGLAAEPVIKILAVTKDGILLQCEAHGDPRPTIKWQDSDNKTLPAEETKISERGRFYITVKIIVTKTGNYTCVATQETRSHQVAAIIPVHIPVPPPESGSSAGLITGFVVISLLFVVAVVAVVLYFKNRIKQIRTEYEEKREPQTEPDLSTSLKESS